MGKIIFSSTSSFGAFDTGPIELLKEAGFIFVSNPFGRKLINSEPIDLLSKYRPIGLIAGTETINKEVFNCSKEFLKVISRVGIGMDNIDLEAARKYGIHVFNTPEAPTEAVAELTIGLILAVLRRISTADQLIRNNKWKPIMGELILGKTVGIIGIGRIGRCVGKILSLGFNAKVIGYDPFFGGDWPAEICSKIDSLDNLLRRSDIISLHLPGNNDTKDLIRENEFKMMKSTAVIINTSRGGIINENDLLNALKSKKISGAGLDVFGNEPYLGPLINCDSVVLTMHMGSYAREARIKMEYQAVENLLMDLKK